MNRIILIGNGFDLAHGLKTGYRDFLCWYWNQRVSPLRINQTRTDDDGLCSLRIKDNVDYDSWMNLCMYSFPQHINPVSNADIIGEIHRNKDVFEVKYSPLFGLIIKSFVTKKWVDIENEYYKLLCPQPIEIHERNPKELNTELELLRQKLTEYLSEVEESLINDTLFNKAIQDIIKGPVRMQDLAVGQSFEEHGIPSKAFYHDAFICTERVLLLNFNYTKTAKLYQSAEKVCEVNHIHGELSNPESIIFGYGDELDENYKTIQNLNDNEYLRNVKSVRYLESDNYRRLLAFIESAPYQIYIMGHSCGNSDRTLLNKLFEHKNCVSIKPFYHQQEKNGTLEDNYLDMVQNISRNFNDKNLMRDRVVNKTYCEALPQIEKT